MKKRNPESGGEESVKTRSPKSRFSIPERIATAVAVLFLLIAAVLFVWDPVMQYLRDKKTESVLQGISAGQVTLVVKRDELAVNGEEYEVFTQPEMIASTDPTALSAEITVAPLPEDVVLTAIGTIKIDAIALYLPLLDSADVIPLRYGAGHLEETVLPGDAGNCVILGHRMKAYGSLFNRLGEVELGDEIQIADINGFTFTYVVDEIIPELDPSLLGDYIQSDDGSGIQITLITCTPTGVGTHRLLIIAHMQE